MERYCRTINEGRFWEQAGPQKKPSSRWRFTAEGLVRVEELREQLGHLWLIPTAEVSADQSRARIHRRRSHAADAAHRLHAVLPRRSGRRRQRHPRHDPPAPVHQGRARLDHHAGAEPRTSTSACSPPPRKCCDGSGCTIASSRSAPATWALPRRRPTTSRSGCRGRTCIAKSRPARSAANSRRGA